VADYLNFEKFNVGDELPALTKEPVTEVQLVKYAGASGDFNPIHTVDAVGKRAGFGGVIAHGMLVMGFAAQAVSKWVPNCSLKKMKSRFVAVTRPGDVITVTGKVKRKKEENGEKIVVCGFQATDQKGEVKLKGQFEAALE